MSTQTINRPDIPEPAAEQRGRWGGIVVETGTVSYVWGTRCYPGRYQIFENGDANLQVLASSTPPPSADHIVRDGLTSDKPQERTIAAVLAKRWEIDIDEVLDQ